MIGSVELMTYTGAHAKLIMVYHVFTTSIGDHFGESVLYVVVEVSSVTLIDSL